MTLAEFKEQSSDFETLRGHVPGIEMIVLVDRVVEAAYLAGLEHGIKRGITVGEKK